MERKKAIVTGASRGIGKGIALSLAQADYDLAISYHSLREEAEAFAHELQVNYGGTCHVFQTDFSEINAAEKFISEADVYKRQLRHRLCRMQLRTLAALSRASWA